MVISLHQSSEGTTPSLSNAAQQALREDLLRKNASTASQTWKSAEASRQIVDVISKLYDLTGKLQPGSSFALRGIGAEADSFRGRVIGDIENKISQLNKDSDGKFNFDTTPIDFTLMNVLESMQGVTTSSSKALRSQIIHGIIGTYANQPEKWNLFVNAFLRSFDGTQGKCDDIMKDFWERLHLDTSENADIGASLYKDQLTEALRGSDSSFAKSIRELLKIPHTPREVRIINRDDPQAWAERRSILKKLDQEAEKKVTTSQEQSEYFYDLETLCLDMAQCNSEESWKFRQELINNKHVDKNDILLSVGSIDTTPAREMYDPLIQAIFTDTYYINKALDDSKKFKLNFKETDEIEKPVMGQPVSAHENPLFSLMGKNSEISWKIRKSLVVDHKIPLAYVLKNSVSGMNTPEADAFVKEMTEPLSKYERKMLILSSMVGSDLPCVWKERDEVIDELRTADRLKIRTFAQKLSLLPENIQTEVINEMKPALLQGNLITSNTSNAGILNLLKKADDSTFVEAFSVEGIDLDKILDTIQTNYFPHHQDLDYSYFVCSLVGCTSEKAAKTRLLLKKEGVPIEILLATAKGVFTNDTRSLRNDFIAIISQNYFSGNDDAYNDSTHQMQALMALLQKNGPSVADVFSP